MVVVTEWGFLGFAASLAFWPFLLAAPPPPVLGPAVFLLLTSCHFHSPPWSLTVPGWGTTGTPRTSWWTFHQAGAWPLATLSITSSIGMQPSPLATTLKPAALPSCLSWKPLWASSLAFSIRALGNVSLQDTALSPWDISPLLHT